MAPRFYAFGRYPSGISHDKQIAKGRSMSIDPERKPSKDERRISGMVATAVLVFLAVFTVVFVMMAG